ncbi:hypothetical protein quinque_010510 [Culex quinquefasciatus]
MEQMNFNPRLIEFLQKITRNSFSRILVNDGRRLTQLVNVIQAYEPVSGAVLNLAKTVALKIGNVETSGIPTWLKFEDSCKILGLIFTDTVKKSMELTWNKILKQLKWRLWMCKSRVLNLIQKVIHINTFISSKLWYAASTLPLPKKFQTQILKEFRNFLWRETTHPVGDSFSPEISWWIKPSFTWPQINCAHHQQDAEK